MTLAAQEKREDEYEHDSSDEEVRPSDLLGSLTFHLCLYRCWDVFRLGGVMSRIVQVITIDQSGDLFRTVPSDRRAMLHVS